ncbi:MAG TPA: redoxin domain-containing protein [bacterium]|nr:redoxin domain-containing protein [bacterium]
MKKFIALLVLFFSAQYILYSEGLKIGSKIPSITGKTLTGKNLTAADYKDKYILIDIGSTMCEPCQKTLIQLQKLKTKYPEFFIIAINIDPQIFSKNLKKFVKENNIDFPIILDENKKLFNAFKADSIPYIIFADKTGTILHSAAGEEFDIDQKFKLARYFNNSNEKQNNPNNSENILAIVGSEIITIDEFQEILSSLPPQYKSHFQNNPQILLEELISQTVLYNEALRQNFDKRQEIKKIIDKTIKNILIQAFIEDQLKNTETKDYQNALNKLAVSLKSKENIKIFSDNLSKLEAKIERIKLPEFIKTTKPVMIALGAESCMPCRMMQPILKELKEEYKNIVDIIYIDLDKESEKSAYFPIQVIPMQFFFDRQGNEIFRHEGYYSKEEIIATLKKILD